MGGQGTHQGTRATSTSEDDRVPGTVRYSAGGCSPLVAADRSWRIPQSGVRTKEGWLPYSGRKGRSSLGRQPERLKYLSRPLPRLAPPLLFLTLEGFFNPSLRRESPQLLILFSFSTHIPRSSTRLVWTISPSSNTYATYRTTY